MKRCHAFGKSLAAAIGEWNSDARVAVVASGGLSHFVVDEEFDHGPVLAQVRVPVRPGDTADRLSARVLEREHILYAKTLQKIATGEIALAPYAG